MEGDIFDPTGIKVKAYWSHGIDEELNKNDISYDKTPLKEGDTKVTITYEGVTLDVAITVVSVKVESIKVEYAGETRFPLGTAVTNNGLKVIAVLEDGTEKEVTAYTLTINSKDVTADMTGEGLKDLEKGAYTVTVTYKDKTGSYNIEVFNGYIIEAEDIYNKDEVPENATNYLEKVSASGVQLGAIRYSDGKKDAEFASGQAYLGEVKKGNSFNVHVYSEVDRKADITMTAASCVISKDMASWKPIEMASVQLNKLLKATANGKDVVITDDVILPGGATQPNEDGSYTYDANIWVKWQSVVFGEMELKKGDNIIYVELIDAIPFEGTLTGGSGTINIDKFEVSFKD
ncbi:MAG TPA: hypothetical protein DDW20_01210 [Firmicutes bacterium]|nr:hypothetical protein [Bacillota bacterium]